LVLRPWVSSWKEASPLSVHAFAHPRGCHRLLGCLLHIEPFLDDSPDGCSDIARCVLTRARQFDDPFAVPTLGEQARSGGTDVPRRNEGNHLVHEKECR
jgi:hypothetical protein